MRCDHVTHKVKTIKRKEKYVQIIVNGEGKGVNHAG